jgi:hypothetical protein
MYHHYSSMAAVAVGHLQAGPEPLPSTSHGTAHWGGQRIGHVKITIPAGMIVRSISSAAAATAAIDEEHDNYAIQH